MRVVFIMAEYSLHNHIISDYLAARPDDQVALVKVPLVLKGKSRVASAQRIVPQLSRRFLTGKILEFLVLLAITRTPKIMRRGAIFHRLRRIARLHDIPFIKIDSIMSDESLSFIRAQNLDVIVSLFHQIIKKEFIAIPKHGIVNIHPGLIPDYRSIQPYFWALAEGADRSGATLHPIRDETIDTGGILPSTSHTIFPGMSTQLCYYLTSQAASRILPKTLRALHAGELAPVPQDQEVGQYYRWPDSKAFTKLIDQGHCLFSWRLWGILRGHYDQITTIDSFSFINQRDRSLSS